MRLRRLEKLAAREVYERRLRSLPGAQRIVEIVFVVALTAFIVLLSIGVLRRWRWTFWLIVITFLFGVLRIRRADVGQRDASWVVLADPESNKFCILRGWIRPDS